MLRFVKTSYLVPFLMEIFLTTIGLLTLKSSLIFGKPISLEFSNLKEIRRLHISVWTRRKVILLVRFTLGNGFNFGLKRSISSLKANAQKEPKKPRDGCPQVFS